MFFYCRPDSCVDAAGWLRQSLNSLIIALFKKIFSVQSERSFDLFLSLTNQSSSSELISHSWIISLLLFSPISFDFTLFFPHSTPCPPSSSSSSSSSSTLLRCDRARSRGSCGAPARDWPRSPRGRLCTTSNAARTDPSRHGLEPRTLPPARTSTHIPVTPDRLHRCQSPTGGYTLCEELSPTPFMF